MTHQLAAPENRLHIQVMAPHKQSAKVCH